MNAATAEKTKRGLGRGLDALFADGQERVKDEYTADIPSANVTASASPTAAPQTLPITALIPTPFQPRKYFDSSNMDALCLSVRTHGILQPLLVRRAPGQNGIYEIIAGERRWRAAQIEQLHDVPVIIKQMDDREAMQIALIENIQRADLSPMEEAEGYYRLITEFGHTQEELGDIMGKSRSAITNAMRLLQLPTAIREKIHYGKISAGHARQLLGMSELDMMRLADAIIKDGLSVREIEKRRKQMLDREMGHAPEAKKSSHVFTRSGAADKDADVLALEKEMGNLLGLAVEINADGKGAGKLNIGFSSLDQLDELLQKLTRAARQ